jgi:hypothetical protein
MALIKIDTKFLSYFVAYLLGDFVMFYFLGLFQQPLLHSERVY